MPQRENEQALESWKVGMISFPVSDWSSTWLGLGNWNGWREMNHCGTLNLELF